MLDCFLIKKGSEWRQIGVRGGKRVKTSITLFFLTCFSFTSIFLNSRPAIVFQVGHPFGLAFSQNLTR